MTTGIYALKFSGTDKVYIGKSRNIEKRFSDHKYSFKNNKASIKMQEAYRELGIPTLEILCECSIEELNKYENEAIEIFNSFNNGFNSLEFAEDMPFPDNKGEKHGRAKYTNEQIIEVFNLLVNNQEKSFKEIEDITKVLIGTIERISCLKNHIWLEQEFPEEYNILKSLKGTRNKSKTAKDMGIKYPIIKSPEGIQYTVENTNKFAREHKLNQSNLCRLLNKKQTTHKGWKLA